MPTRRIAFFLLLLAPVAAPGCGHGGEPPAADSTAPVAVSVERASLATLASSFEAGGSVRARLTAPIASRVLAPVTEVRVRAGDRVRRGDALVALDARERTADHERAKAAAQAAQAAAAAAAADVASAEAGLTLAQASHQRIADLAAKRSATAQELDQATAALRAAEAQLRGAQARLAAAEAQQHASLSAAAAADTALGYTVIRAPFDGLVLDRAVDPGAMATPGTPLLTLEDPSALRLDVRLDEARAAMVEPGARVRVLLTTGTGEESVLDGTVAEIAGVDPASHAFLVKIDLDGRPAGTDGPVLRSGTFGRARFTGLSRQALTIPEAAVVRRGQLTFVFTVDDDRRAHLRAVSLGSTADETVEVLAGLVDGTAVVVRPPATLRDGGLVEASGLSAGAPR